MFFVLTLCTIAIIASSQTWEAYYQNLRTNPISTKVGIGISSPNTYLHVNTYTSIDPFRVQVNGNTKLWVRTNGGVSIGEYYSTPPDNGLYVGGNLRVKGNKEIILNSPNMGTPRLAIKQYEDNIYMDYMYDLHFRNDVSWKSALVLQNDGNIAIGVDTKYTSGYDYCNGFKLSVNGKIRCEEIKVIVDVPSADYVFDPNYKLLSLAEVREFIVKNRRLPGIQSAEDFKKFGYSVGEMDNALLEKVEELTLYIIELESRISELENSKKL